MHTLACEQDMLEWINEHSDSTFKDLKDFKPVKNSTYEAEPAEFQFDNTFGCDEETHLPFFDDDSADEN